MPKSQEQRIKDAAQVLAPLVTGCASGIDYGAQLHGRSIPSQIEEMAAKVLEAADREPPEWPTQESVDAFNTTDDGNGYIGVRNAMLADPIIKAAIAYRDRQAGRGAGQARALEVIDAVNEAGL